MNSSLLKHFAPLPDPRIERTKRYPLIEIIFLVISATLSGCEGWKAIKDFGDLKLDWLRQFFPYTSGIPVDDTIARVMRRLDPQAFQHCFVNWVQSAFTATAGDVVAIDGKQLRRSHDKAHAQSPIHMVSAWSCANGIVLGQEKTAEKSNEIKAIPELLQVLALKGCIVTIDAMGTQKAIATQIQEKQADYVLALKGNQGSLHADVRLFCSLALERQFQGVKHDFYEETDAGHGRIEHRQCWVIPVKPYAKQVRGTDEWVGLKSLVMVKTQREMAERTTQETRYYIASIQPTAQAMLAIVRNHWQVENALHWTLDVTFREDESRIRKDAAPENFAVMRHIALNILKSDQSINASVKRKRAMAALSDDVRTKLIQQAFSMEN